MNTGIFESESRSVGEPGKKMLRLPDASTLRLVNQEALYLTSPQNALDLTNP